MQPLYSHGWASFTYIGLLPARWRHPLHLLSVRWRYPPHRPDGMAQVAYTASAITHGNTPYNRRKETSKIGPLLPRLPTPVKVAGGREIGIPHRGGLGAARRCGERPLALRQPANFDSVSSAGAPCHTAFKKLSFPFSRNRH